MDKKLRDYQVQALKLDLTTTVTEVVSAESSTAAIKKFLGKHKETPFENAKACLLKKELINQGKLFE